VVLATKPASDEYASPEPEPVEADAAADVPTNGVNTPEATPATTGKTTVTEIPANASTLPQAQQSAPKQQPVTTVTQH
jgi:hypothetical protein